MKLSWLTLVSFLLIIITISGIRTRRHGCCCCDYKPDFDICNCEPECECGCRSSANSGVVEAAKLKKLPLIHLPSTISHERTYQSDYVCPHCSRFPESPGLPRTHFGTWKHRNNRLRRFINKFKRLYSNYPGFLLSKRRFPNIFESSGPLHPTIDGNVGSGNRYSALNPYYGNTGSFNSEFEALRSRSITSDQSNGDGCDCGNMHSLHEPNSFAFENDEFSNNKDCNYHCNKKAVSECDNFLKSKAFKKSPQRKNAFEEKLAFGPTKIPVDITKKEVLQISDDNLQNVKSCSCQRENKKQKEIEKILKDNKGELKLKNKNRKNEPLGCIIRSEYPLMSFQPPDEFSVPILQQNTNNELIPYVYYENDWDEENEEYGGDFRILEDSGNCRCGDENSSPKNEIIDGLTSNYENARILHLEPSEYYR